MTSGQEQPKGSPPVGEEPSDSAAGGWSQRWEWPWFRLVMFGGFSIFTLDDALHRDGLWRIVYGIACVFFLVAFLLELRPVINRRHSNPGGPSGKPPEHQ